MSATLEIVRAQMQALEAEVARLREADATATKAIDTLTAMHATAARSAEQWHDKYAAERAAHVKALGELNLARIRSQAHHNRAEAAEARVTELEGALRVVSDRAVSEALLRQDALAWARELLERAVHSGWDKNMQDEYRVWLRAHPATATPAATGTGRQHCSEHAGWRSDCEQCAEKGQATPAATGAELEKPATQIVDLFEALKQALQKAEKEQGT